MSKPTAIEIFQHIQGITLPGSDDKPFFQNENGQFGLIGSRNLAILRNPSDQSITNLAVRVHSRSANGYGPDQEISALYIEVDTHKRGRRNSAFSSVKVDLTREDWPEKLTNAVVSGFFVLTTRHENNVKASSARLSAEQSRKDYANSITTLLGERVYNFHVLHGPDGFPAALRVDVTVTGTPEQVAEKIRKIRAISA